MAQNLARDYADSMLKQITEAVDSGCPFGVVNLYTGDVFSDMSEALDNTDADEQENLGAASGMDYLGDALDIKYIVNSDRSYLSAKVCIGYGGPNVWINTDTNELEVYWGSRAETRALPAEFIRGLDDALGELWEMGS